VNDLDMDDYIRNLTTDLDIMTSMAPPKTEDFIKTDMNTPFGPTFNVPYSVAKGLSVDGMEAVSDEFDVRNSFIFEKAWM